MTHYCSNFIFCFCLQDCFDFSTDFSAEDINKVLVNKPKWSTKITNQIKRL